MQLKPIIQAKFKRFKDTFELNSLQDGLAFERFVNHAILTFHQPDAFSADSDFLEKVCVGGMLDTGIDGVAIKINGILVKSKEDVDEIMERPKDIDVELIFIQSKYKPNFDTSEFLKFISGVRDFMAPTQRLPKNSKITEMIDLKNYVFSDEFVSKWDSNPKAKLYYAAMGIWQNDSNLNAIADQAKEDIKALNTYEEPDIQFVDEEVLKEVCDSNENRFDITIKTYDIMELTPVEGVENSCIAVCYADEFIKLLTVQDSGEIRKSLFEDNVRDYQGENTVNTEIANTIKNDPSKFILLNNGITIVCDDFKTSTKRITIKNPQIVNGCQTSHVLFYSQKQGIDISKLPLNIKIISTEDIGISNQIVRGTNRQNQVLEEAFETTRPFHQRLEEFFTSYSHSSDKIYYERRSKQYNYNPTIKRTHVINMRILIQSFTAMFLNKPHESHRHESRMLRELKGVVFLDKHSYLPYYTSALAFFYLERMFREMTISTDVRSFKPHLLMMFREVAGGRLPQINSSNIDEYCTTVLKCLTCFENAKSIFEKVTEIFYKAKDIWILDKKRSRDGMKDVAEFTELLLQEVRNAFHIKTTDLPVATATIFQSTVLSTLQDRNAKWYGFIRKSPDNIFFHSSQNQELDFNNLRGQVVEYSVSQNGRDGREFAVNVKVI